MSKSKRNVVTPDAMAEKYGADALRTYELFVAPFEDAVQWNEDGMSGAFRFMGRVWRLANDWDHRFDPDWRSKVAAEASSELRAKALRRKTHQTTRKVGEDIERMHFNTAIAALMELVNQMADFASGVSAASPPGDRAALSEAMATLPLLLSPFAPHLADELAERLGLLGDSVSLFNAPWPAWDEEVAREVEVTVVVQVNGKVRDRLTVAAGTGDERLKELALQSERAKVFIAGKAVRNVVVVPDKLVNIVVQ
jgi:leucyl-tRNA synthetase